MSLSQSSVSHPKDGAVQFERSPDLRCFNLVRLTHPLMAARRGVGLGSGRVRVGSGGDGGMGGGV